MSELSLKGRFYIPQKVLVASGSEWCQEIFLYFKVSDCAVSHAKEEGILVTFIASALHQVHFSLPLSSWLGVECCLTGSFASTKVRGQRLLVASHLAFAVQPSCNALKRKAMLSGRISLLSDPQHLPNGFAAFCSVQVQGSSDETILVIQSEALQLLPLLQIGQEIEVYHAKSFSWRSADGQQVDGQKWWMVSQLADISIRDMATAVAANASAEEVSLTGNVQHISSGWLLLHSAGRVTKVFFQHFHRSTLSAPWYALCRGCQVMVHNLLPVYLFGKLEGYAYSVRSCLQLLTFPVAAGAGSSNGSRPASTILDQVDRISAHIRKGCYTMSAWRARAATILQSHPSVDQLLTMLLAFHHTVTSCTAADQLQPPRIVQKEFSESWYVSFHLVRAGMDADHLSSMFPRIVPLDNVMTHIGGHNHTASDLSDFYTVRSTRLPGSCCMVVCQVSAVTALHGALCVILTHGLHKIQVLVQKNTLLPAIFDQADICVLHDPELVVEEQPWSAQGDALVTALMPLQHIALYKHEHGGYDEVDLPTEGVLEAPVGLTVRDLLRWALRPAASAVLMNQPIAAVIIKKRILLDEYNDLHQGTAVKRKRDEGGIKKISLVLRDTCHADNIHMYAPSNEAAGIMVGMTVAITNVCLSNPVSNRRPYLKSLGSATTHFRLLSMQIPVGPSLEPPLSNIRYLYAHRSHDRCLYRFVGMVSFIRKLHVSLKCSKCFKLAVQAQLQWTCPTCRTAINVSMAVDCQLSFDDNTAEASVRLEGDMVYDMLASGCRQRDLQGKAMLQLKAALEGEVRRTGRFAYDHVAELKQKLSLPAQQQQAGDDIDPDLEEDLLLVYGEDVLEAQPTADQLAVAALLVGKLINQPKEALLAYLRLHDKSVLLELTARVDMFKSKGDQQMSSRLVKVQEVNTARPHLVHHRQCQTLLQPRLELVADSVRPVRDQMLADQCFHILAQLTAE